MTETALRKKFRELCRDRRWLAIRITSLSFRGWPDWLLIFPNGRHVFVELKATGGKPTALQKTRHRELRRFKQFVLIIDNVDRFKWLINLSVAK